MVQRWCYFHLLYKCYLFLQYPLQLLNVTTSVLEKTVPWISGTISLNYNHRLSNCFNMVKAQTRKYSLKILFSLPCPLCALVLASQLRLCSVGRWNPNIHTPTNVMMVSGYSIYTFYFCRLLLLGRQSYELRQRNQVSVNSLHNVCLDLYD